MYPKKRKLVDDQSSKSNKRHKQPKNTEKEKTTVTNWDEFYENYINPIKSNVSKQTIRTLERLNFTRISNYREMPKNMQGVMVSLNLRAVKLRIRQIEAHYNNPSLLLTFYNNEKEEYEVLIVRSNFYRMEQIKYLVNTSKNLDEIIQSQFLIKKVIALNSDIKELFVLYTEFLYYWSATNDIHVPFTIEDIEMLRNDFDIKNVITIFMKILGVEYSVVSYYGFLIDVEWHNVVEIILRGIGK